MDFRQTLFKYRSYTPIPFLIVMAVAARPTAGSMLLGFCLAAVGEFLRLWSVALAGGETRTRDRVGASMLVTNGPFAHVRNPLYIGNMLIYFGTGIMANTPLLAIAALFYFFIQYSLIVSLEEESLLKLFGADYLKYAEAVPRFAPALKKYRGGGLPQPGLDWMKGIRSEKRSLQASALVIAVLLIIWHFRG